MRTPITYSVTASGSDQGGSGCRALTSARRACSVWVFRIDMDLLLYRLTHKRSPSGEPRGPAPRLRRPRPLQGPAGDVERAGGGAHREASREPGGPCLGRRFACAGSGRRARPNVSSLGAYVRQEEKDSLGIGRETLPLSVMR